MKTISSMIVPLPIACLSLLVGSSFLVAASAPAQTRHSGNTVDTLALVNGQPITSEDFKNRFDLSIYPGEDYRDTTKMDFLFSMIAEKLLSEAAETGGQPLTPEEKEIIKQTEDIFLRDALYRTKVMPQAGVNDDELVAGVKLSTYSYLLDAFYFKDNNAASRFYDEAVLQKKNIYRVADSLSVSHDTLLIGYGESTKEIEDACFGHKSGFISKPTQTVDGIIVFRILERKVNTKYAGMATDDRLAAIRKIILGRKETELGAKYLGQVMKDVKVDVNYEIFRPLVYAIQKILVTQHPASFDQYYLAPADMLTLRSEFSRYLSSQLLTFAGGGITLDEVFDELPLSGFSSPSPSIPEITMELHSALRFISQNYFLSRKAVELGLENSGEVKYNVGMFLDAFRSSRVANQIVDTVTVTQNEVDKFFEKHHDEVLNGVNLKLKSYESVGINEAVDIYDRLLAAKKSGTADTSGEWVRASSLGEIGAVLAEQANGSVYGPLFEDGKFHIYQVIDKRSTISQEAISHSVEVAREMLTEQIRERTLDRYVAGLAEKADVKIYYPEVRTLKVTPVEMLTFRYIGFGGKILAVPLLYPRERWIRYFKPNRPPAP